MDVFSPALHCCVSVLSPCKFSRSLLPPVLTVWPFELTSLSLQRNGGEEIAAVLSAPIKCLSLMFSGSITPTLQQGKTIFISLRSLFSARSCASNCPFSSLATSHFGFPFIPVRFD